jgi:glycosyltransferase involved in cell wall biosynthesis
MKILQLTNHCRRSGNGIVNVAVDLACAQAADGHQVAFASAGGDYASLLASRGIRHFEVDQRSRAPQKLAIAAFRLYRVLREFRPDVVHAHMMTGAVLAKTFAPLFGYAMVTTVHNEFQKSASVMRLGDRVIAVSDAVAAALAKRRFPRGKIKVVYNGTVGTLRLPAMDGVAVERLNRPAIVTVAGLYHRKGIADLIDAFGPIASRHATAHLYIVGDGPQRGVFEAMARASPAQDRIVFAGFCTDPRSYMRAADIFVLASHEEPFGLVLTEAREAGCAIIATDVGGVSEALDGGAAGILVPARRSDLLANALIGLLDRPEDREKLRARAVRNLDVFSVTRVSRETLAVYNDALASRGTLGLSAQRN